MSHSDSAIKRSCIKTVVGSMSADDSDGNLDTETLYISTEDFPNICRLCLRNEKLRKLKDHLHLTDVIRNITNIEVKRFDGYPQHICEICILQLENILEFIDSTRNCNESLQRVLESTNEKRHMCDVCPKSFAHIGALKRHLERHNEVQKYICFICNRGFGRRNHLTHHLTTHTADKPFYCTICSRGFATEKKLKIHKERHAANKPLQCEVCPKKFRNMQELRQHTRYHTGQRPYSCKPCNKSFRQLGHLNLHLSTKHKNKDSITEDMVIEDIVIEHVIEDEEPKIEETVLDGIIKEEVTELKSEMSTSEQVSTNDEKSTILPVCMICSKQFEVCFTEDT